jgi:hypothetical protein
MIEQERGLELKWKLFGCRHGGEVGQLRRLVATLPTPSNTFIWPVSCCPARFPTRLGSGSNLSSGPDYGSTNLWGCRLRGRQLNVIVAL